MRMELILRLLGSLALLIYGMKTMSDALQKLNAVLFPKCCKFNALQK